MALRGEHINDPNLIYTTASRVKVKSSEKILLNLDGELGGEAPATFENLYRHLEVFVPIDKIRPQDKIN
jgi:diacylglycerol kinase (ATP)